LSSFQKKTLNENHFALHRNTLTTKVQNTFSRSVISQVVINAET